MPYLTLSHVLLSRHQKDLISVTVHSALWKEVDDDMTLDEKSYIQKWVKEQKEKSGCTMGDFHNLPDQFVALITGNLARETEQANIERLSAVPESFDNDAYRANVDDLLMGLPETL
jgi:hypothetical protein